MITSTSEAQTSGTLLLRCKQAYTVTIIASSNLRLRSTIKTTTNTTAPAAAAMTIKTINGIPEEPFDFPSKGPNEVSFRSSRSQMYGEKSLKVNWNYSRAAGLVLCTSVELDFQIWHKTSNNSYHRYWVTLEQGRTLLYALNSL